MGIRGKSRASEASYVGFNSDQLPENRTSRDSRKLKDRTSGMVFPPPGLWRMAWCLTPAERADAGRMIGVNEHYTVLCPFASRTSWHVRFVPTEELPQSFTDVSDESLAVLAMLMKNALASLETAIGSPFSFNLILPHPRIDRPPEFRWMLDLLPRTGRIAGWEFLSGVDIVTVSPERAAEELKSLGA